MILPPVRSNSRIPRSFSSTLICKVTAGCVRKSCSAALRKFRCSATARNTLRRKFSKCAMARLCRIDSYYFILTEVTSIRTTNDTLTKGPLRIFDDRSTCFIVNVFQWRWTPLSEAQAAGTRCAPSTSFVCTTNKGDGCGSTWSHYDLDQRCAASVRSWLTANTEFAGTHCQCLVCRLTAS